MTSSKPYLFRALLDWIIDNKMTPYIAVNTLHPKTQVPVGYDVNGQIVLDISAGAVRDLHIDSEGVSFSARFRGQSHTVFAPTGSIIGIYAKENGQGMAFEMGQSAPEEPAVPAPVAKRPSLSVVK